MNTNMYAEIMKAGAYTPEYVEADDPDYMEFRRLVNEAAARNNMDSVRKNKFHGLWFVNSTFRDHWHKPQKNSTNAMLWSAYHHDWDFEEGIVLILAWWQHHHRKGTPDQLQEVINKVATPAWDQTQPYLIDKRNKRYQKKKVKRHEKQAMKNKAKLHYRIIEAIRKQGKATIASLAAELNESPKAIEGQLYRLSRPNLAKGTAAEVVKVMVNDTVVRGLYALPGAETLC